MSVGHPYREEGTSVRYRDPEDQGHEDSSWGDAPKPDISKDDICAFPLEHRGVVASPTQIVALSRWYEANPDQRPEGHGDWHPIRFYAFVQPEGSFVLSKRHNVHAVVSFGQSFAVAHNFLEPQHVMEMYRPDGEVVPDGKPVRGVRHCSCVYGELHDDTAMPDLGLRKMAAKHVPWMTPGRKKAAMGKGKGKGKAKAGGKPGKK